MKITKDGVIVQATENDLKRYAEKAKRREKKDKERDMRNKAKNDALKKLVALGLSSDDLEALFGTKVKL